MDGCLLSTKHMKLLSTFVAIYSTYSILHNISVSLDAFRLFYCWLSRHRRNIGAGKYSTRTHIKMQLYTQWDNEFRYINDNNLICYDGSLHVCMWMKFLNRFQSQQNWRYADPWIWSVLEMYRALYNRNFWQFLPSFQHLDRVDVL